LNVFQGQRDSSEKKKGCLGKRQPGNNSKRESRNFCIQKKE
jgi:hypothetical protein